MAEEYVPPPRSQALQYAIEKQGSEPEDEFERPLKFGLLQILMLLSPLLLLLGFVAGILFTKGYLACTFMTLGSLLLLPAIQGLRGSLEILRVWNVIVLIYKDRMVWIRGSKEEIIYWDNVAEVNIKTIQSGYEVNYEPPSSLYLIHLITPILFGHFWKEWLDIYQNEGQILRVPSSIISYDELSEAVQKAVNSRIGPLMQKNLNAGERVEFGPLVLHRDYLEIYEEQVEWDDFKSFSLNRGKFWAERMNDEVVGDLVPVETVSNLGLAMYFITDLRHHPDPPEE